MRIGIYSRLLKGKEQFDFLKNLLSRLEELRIECLIEQSFAEQLSDFQGISTFQSNQLKEGQLDVLLSIGGDGTMLDTLSIVRSTAIPVLGVNTGRFGFLASSQLTEIDQTLEYLIQNKYTVEKRTVLELHSDEADLGEFPFALNDFVIHKKDTSSMITVHAYMNSEFLNSYWADGLIVATPTGSSGYSLSCGGPLIFPGSSSMIVTPIAPHNLTVRPAVVSDSNQLSFEVEGRSDSFLATLDSRSVSIKNGVRIHLKKADFSFHMIRLEGMSYMETIRKKLMWGRDNRN